MLYTVMPLERIYKNFREDDKENQQFTDKENPEYREILLKHGRIVTRRQGEDYIIERIHSTDMRDYLRKDYMPGKTFKR